MIYIIIQTDCDVWSKYDELTHKNIGYVDSKEKAIEKCFELEKKSEKYFTWDKNVFPKFSWEEIKPLEGE